MNQRVIYSDYEEVSKWVENKKVFLVCGDMFDQLEIKKCFKNEDIVRFSDFTPNPDYESVKKGVRCFKCSGCNAIVAVGGGSTIDVAKCIKLYSNMDNQKDYLEQDVLENSIPFMVMPTTAGTGSESTRFAVIYKNGNKISVTHDSCIPDTVFFDGEALNNLPIYYRKATLLDSFCHAIESYWSINSTEKSKAYSKEAIELILDNWRGYITADKKAQVNMLKAANIAGKAINIAQTTAGHAMCYKLTTLYGIAHGHAAALCVSKIWPYMIKRNEQVNDRRGKEYIFEMFMSLASIMGQSEPLRSAEMFNNILNELEMQIPRPEARDYEILIKSVNEDRLKNNPIKFSYNDISKLYHEILEEKNEQ